MTQTQKRSHIKTEADVGGMRPRARGCPEAQKLQETGNISSKANAMEDFKMKVLKMLPLKLLIQYMFPLILMGIFQRPAKAALRDTGRHLVPCEAALPMPRLYPSCHLNMSLDGKALAY